MSFLQDDYVGKCHTLWNYTNGGKINAALWLLQDAIVWLHGVKWWVAGS